MLLFLTAFFAPTISAKESLKNHPYAGVQIPYAKSELGGCSYQYSPVDFCDDAHVSAIKNALQTERANYFGNYIILRYSERPEYYQKSILIIDVNTGYAYPLPIDAYSGFIKGKGVAVSDGVVKYSISDDRICISGAILVYKSIQQGSFCFDFDGKKFGGFHTEYMFP
ncbi:hypothetical protein [Robbsia sp. KACC 23696]|uniref:hypothetical protein n=1 Tax=Robbsia sp. KACC 23696 TaxID=3149231 RepID=UPI00325B7718